MKINLFRSTVKKIPFYKVFFINKKYYKFDSFPDFLNLFEFCKRARSLRRSHPYKIRNSAI